MKKLNFDLLYINNYSILLDIKILFNTVIAIFSFNNYFINITDFDLNDLINESNFNIITQNSEKLVIKKNIF